MRDKWRHAFKMKGESSKFFLQEKQKEKDLDSTSCVSCEEEAEAKEEGDGSFSTKRIKKQMSYHDHHHSIT